jgi:sulfoxide reductase heme-binding subunit YedZ
MHTDPTPYLFWITSRAAGIAALMLSTVAVLFGLLMSTRLLRNRIADLRAGHEVLALTAIGALIVHALALLGDRWLHPTLADIAIPFASSYKTGWTTLGIVAGWGAILLGLSFYARRRIGARRWRSLHRFTALAWVFGLIHALGEGTDAGQLWFLAMIGIVVVPALALLAARVCGMRISPPRPGSAGAAASA